MKLHRVPLQLFVTSIVAILLAQAAALGKFEETPVAQCVLDNLRTLSKKKVSGKLGKLPKRVDLTVGKTEATDLFNKGVALWRESWTDENVDTLRDIAKTVKKGKDVSDDKVREVNLLRADLKLMRFWFASLSKDHKIPENFDELTTAIGKMRDVPTLELWQEEKDRAQRVLQALSPESLKAMENELRDFKPSSRTNSLEWSKEILDDTQAIVDAGSGTAEDFHTVRKSLQAFLSIIQVKLSTNMRSKDLKIAYQRLVDLTDRIALNVRGFEIDAERTKNTLRSKPEDRPKNFKVFNFNKTVVKYPPKLVAEVKRMVAFLRRSTEDKNQAL